MEVCKKHTEDKVLYGKKWRCRSCNREYQRTWFAQNRKTQRERNQVNAERTRETNVTNLVEYLKANPCIDCGETDILVLTFDHVDPEDKSMAVARMLRYHSWEKIAEEIKKCEVRCANCHMRRTAQQFGWRKLKWV